MQRSGEEQLSRIGGHGIAHSGWPHDDTPYTECHRASRSDWVARIITERLCSVLEKARQVLVVLGALAVKKQ